MASHARVVVLRVVLSVLASALLSSWAYGQAGAWYQTKLETLPARSEGGGQGSWSYTHEGDFGSDLMTGRCAKHMYSFGFTWSAPPNVVLPGQEVTVPISVELAGKQVPPGTLLACDGKIRARLEVVDSQGKMVNARPLYAASGTDCAQVSGLGAVRESRSLKVSIPFPEKTRPEGSHLRLVVYMGPGAGEFDSHYMYRYEWRESAPLPPAGDSGWTGTWETDFGTLVLKVKGNRVTGTYTSDNGRIEGTLSGDGTAIEGTWSEAPSYKPPKDAGTFRWVLGRGGSTFTGKWGYGEGSRDRPWAGRRP